MVKGGRRGTRCVCPMTRQLNLVGNGGDFFDDPEGSITFWGEFGLLMSEFEMGCFEPYLISRFVLRWDWSPGFCHMIDRIDGH